GVYATRSSAVRLR
nr:Chain C, Vimentin59-71 [synthetic construct]6ATF_F Chain F, Vimentin59-71 [synthetic construct]